MKFNCALKPFSIPFLSFRFSSCFSVSIICLTRFLSLELLQGHFWGRSMKMCQWISYS